MQIAIFFPDGKTETVECDEFESTNTTLRLFSDNNRHYLIGQFRLSGEGAIAGWAVAPAEDVPQKEAGQAELP